MNKYLEVQQRLQGRRYRWLATGNGATRYEVSHAANAVRADLLAAMAKSDVVNQVYNGMAGDRTTLNELYGMMKTFLSGNFVHMAAHAPDDVDFRQGDVRHSQADMSTAVLLDMSRLTVSMTACGKRWTGSSTWSRKDHPMFSK